MNNITLKNNGIEPLNNNLNNMHNNKENLKKFVKWIMISLFLSIALILTINFHIREINLKHNGNSVLTISKLKPNPWAQDNNKSKPSVRVEYTGSEINIRVDGKIKYSSNGTVEPFHGNNSVNVLSVSNIVYRPKGYGIVTLYYKDNDIQNAKALTVFWIWIVIYSILILLITLCVRVTYKTHTHFNIQHPLF